MALIDSILNLAALLLWFNWRSLQVVAMHKSPPLSLVSTLKKAEVRRGARWLPLASLVGLLGMRSLFYWNVGAAVHWTPSLQLGVVSLPFRSDYLDRILLFSILSFGLVLGVGYAWLLLISIINRGVATDEPLQKLVRLHLGWVERWPAGVKFALPMLVTALLWWLGSPGLVELGIIPDPVSRSHVWQQALVLGLTSFLTWKFLLLAVCLLYLVNTYVYLGDSLFWNFVNMTGSNLLRPLQRLPVRIGKLDFSPVLGILLVVVVAHWADQWLPRLYQSLPF